MSSHHSIKFFLTHYEQVAGAIERKVVNAQIRKLRKEADALRWADYRRKREVVKAAATYLYWSEAAFYIVTLATVASIVLFGLRGI